MVKITVVKQDGGYVATDESSKLRAAGSKGPIALEALLNMKDFQRVHPQSEVMAGTCTFHGKELLLSRLLS